jgi:hypothetical protein
MGLSPAFLEELRRRTILSELISRRGVKLMRRGREFAGLCPFHSERTPSFYVVDAKRFYHCFGRGAHGDAIEFVRRADNCDFSAAICRLAGAVAPPSKVVPPLSHNGTARRPETEKLAADRRRARWIWDRALPARGMLADAYLASRGLSLPPAPAAALRWAPALRSSLDAHQAGRDGRPDHWPRQRDDRPPPNLFAERRPGQSGSHAAVGGARQPQGRRRRRSAVRPDRWLIVAEGSRRRSPPCKPMGSSCPVGPRSAARGIESLILPCEAAKVLLVADHDHYGIGERRARAGRERFLREGRRVRFWRPLDPGAEANDVLMGN